MNQLSDQLFYLEARFPGIMSIAMALIKGMAILCLAWGLARLLRHRSAIARAWVWRSGFVAMLLLAAWPYRPLLLNVITLEVRVPTEAVVVSHLSVRRQAADEPAVVAGQTVAPLVIGKDTSVIGDMKKWVRKLDPWVVQVWWVDFVGLLGVKILRSVIGLQRLRGCSRAVSGNMQDACARVAAASRAKITPELRVVTGIGSPLLTGGRQPVIWLPQESADWSAAKLDAVLHHEIAHLTRHDGRWQWIATAAACFWWWNPVVWFALARLKGETEQAADEIVLVGKVPAADYAQALVEIASALLPRPANAFGVPMLGVSAIEQRVRAMLRDNPWRGRTGAMATTALAMLSVLMSGIVLVSCKQKPPAYISLAKLVAGGRMVGGANGVSVGIQYQDYLQDFYGTIIETIESSEMHRRAVDRVRALHPDMKASEVEIQVRQNKGSAIFNVVATGIEPKYTRVFLDALLDEFIAFRNQIRETQRNKALTTLAEDVVRREKNLQEKQDKLTKFEKTESRVIILGGLGAQSLQKLNEERDSMTSSVTDLDLWIQDVQLGVELREAKQKIGSSSQRDDFGDSLTLNEREYLKTQHLIDQATFEKTKLLKTTGTQNPKIAEMDEELNDATGLLKFYEDKISVQWSNQKAAIERRLAALESLIKRKEEEAIEQAAKIATYDALKKDYDDSKRAYDDILDLVRRFTVGEDMTSDHVTIMERASGAIKEEPKGWFGKYSPAVAPAR